jgi:hypothetical protein
MSAKTHIDTLNHPNIEKSDEIKPAFLYPLPEAE